MAARREVCQGRAELRPCHSIPLPMTHIGPYLHPFDTICTHAPGPHNNVAVPERSVMVCATMLLVAQFQRLQYVSAPAPMMAWWWLFH